MCCDTCRSPGDVPPDLAAARDSFLTDARAHCAKYGMTIEAYGGVP